MLKKIGLALLVALVGLAAVIASRPDTFTVERSATLAAPPEVVYGLVADFHHWKAWSLWHSLDPNMKTTFEGAPSGTGAIYSWDGDDKAGAGKMTILEAKSPSEVHIQLEFIRPFAGTNATDITFAPEAGGTRITWKMSGQNNFVSKAFQLFMSMDTVLGEQFDTNFANLGKVAEAEVKKQAEAEAARKAAEEAAAADAQPPAEEEEAAPVAADAVK